MNICESCHGGCCRSFAVPLTGADIIRVERSLGLDFWDFVCRWTDPNGSIARKYAPHVRFSDDPHTDYVICLRHEESSYLRGTTKCRFLVECEPDQEHPLGTARCGIYAARPAACRAFPTKFNADSELAVIYDVPQRGREDSEPAYELCPRPWEPSDVDPITTYQELAVARAEMEFFKGVAQIWNRNPRSWQVFPEFLRLVYSNRILCERDTTATHAPPKAATPAPEQSPRQPIRRAA